MATDFRNSGSGSQYSNTLGTQNNNSGSGNQFNANTINYNAQNQSDSKLLADLRVTDPRNDRRRIERRKGGLFRDSYRWILDHEAFVRWQTDTQSSLLWIRGDPGKGKTMLICGIIDELPARMPGWDTIYFFCEATDSRLNSATAVLRSLLYLLLRKRPLLSRFIREEHEHAGKRLFEDANGWDVLDGTFTNIVEDGGLDDFILIIDALDECSAGLDQLLDFIVRLSLLNVKVIASSRNWLSIEEVVIDVSDQVCISLELNETSISAAVNRYISHKVDQLASRKRYDVDTRNYIYNRLSSKANDTFLWVALVTDQLGKPGVSQRHARVKVEEFPQDLDALYKRMLDRTWKSNDKDRCRRILAIASIVYRPVTLLELMRLADLGDFCNKTEILEEIVGECGSLLTVKDNIIYFVHQSAKDFLFRHALAEIMPSGIHHEHSRLFSRSLEVMSKTCRRNMYNIQEPGASIDHIYTPVPDPLEPARYACTYWLEHATDGGHMDEQQCFQVYDFLKQHFLHWMEALSLLKSMSGGISSLFKLTRAIQSLDLSEPRLFIQDALRFIRYFCVTVESWPLQLYSSALIFSPRHSIIRKQFQNEVAKWIIKQPVVEDEWGSCLQTLEGHQNAVRCLAVSPDGLTLASASKDTTAKIWDITTGQCLRTLQCVKGQIVSVVFSLRGDTLALAARDGICAVELWNKATDEPPRRFGDHRQTGHDLCVAFCAGDQQVALGSQETVDIWNIATGQRVQRFHGTAPLVLPTILPFSAAFSADGTLFASCAGRGRVELFDTETGACLKTLDLQRISGSSPRESLAFSCDSTRLLTCSSGGTLSLWDLTTGQCIWTDKIEFNFAPLAYSRDGRLIASSVRHHNAVIVRDAETGVVLQRLSTNTISTLAFSVDGIQLVWGSEDRMIRVWDLSGLQSLRVYKTEMLFPGVPSTTMSPKTKPLSEGDATRRERLSPSSHGAAKDCTTTNRYLDTIDTDNSRLDAIAFSHDGRQVATVSQFSFRIWDYTAAQCFKRVSRLPAVPRVCSLNYSKNGFQLAENEAGHITIFDALTGLRLKTFETHTKVITSIAFSNDGATLASASNDKRIKLWNPATGDCIVAFTVPSVIYGLRFSESGSQLITTIGNINLESLTTTVVGLLTPRTPEVTNTQGFALSVEDKGSWIRKNSKPILWVPPEYRSSWVYDVRGSAIALGCASGRVLMMEFSSDLSVI